MHVNATALRKVTFEEFCRLVPDGQKADLIGGVIYMASPDNWEAATLFGLLFRVIADFIDLYDLGVVLGPRVAFRLGKREGPEPDIGFLRKERVHLARRGYVDGPPDAGFEIVSPDSVERDYVRKRHQYREAKVPEYWIIDEVNHLVTLLRLDARGRYRVVRPRNGRYMSRVLPGFFLRAEWLWQNPLPKKSALLQRILDESEMEPKKEKP
jgi:Uma2 family endonuclease